MNSDIFFRQNFLRNLIIESQTSTWKRVCVGGETKLLYISVQFFTSDVDRSDSISINIKVQIFVSEKTKQKWSSKSSEDFYFELYLSYV